MEFAHSTTGMELEVGGIISAFLVCGGVNGGSGFRVVYLLVLDGNTSLLVYPDMEIGTKYWN